MLRRAGASSAAPHGGEGRRDPGTRSSARRPRRGVGAQRDVDPQRAVPERSARRVLAARGIAVLPKRIPGGEGCRASLATARDLGGVQGAPVEGSRREPANVVLVPTRSFRGQRRKFWGGNAQARYGGRGRLGGRGLGLAPALCDRGESRSFLGLASATCSLAAVRFEPDRPQALSFLCRGRDQVPSSCPSGPGRRGFTKAVSPKCVLNLLNGRHPFTPRPPRRDPPSRLLCRTAAGSAECPPLCPEVPLGRGDYEVSRKRQPKKQGAT